MKYFQNEKRNFVSSSGHVRSSIYALLVCHHCSNLHCLLRGSNAWISRNTINSRYCGHPRDSSFMSVIAGWEKKVLSTYNIINNINYVRKIFLIRESRRVRSIGKSDLDFQNLNPDFLIKREIRKRNSPPRNPSSGCISIKKSKPGFHGFPFYRSIGKFEKGFAKIFSWTVVFFLLSMRARAGPLFLRNFSNPFSDFPIER